MRGFFITRKGFALLAKLQAGSTLEITRVMVGGGQVPEDANPLDLEDLVRPIVPATSTKPAAVDRSVTFTVEYRSDLGKLERDFLINEFGVFANDPEEGEVLLYYANLGDSPEPVRAYTPNGPVCSRRYPVSITISDGVGVVLGYMASAYMTAEDVEQYCTTTILPMFLENVQKLVDKHNEDPEAHPPLRRSVTALDSRLSLLEVMFTTEVSGNPFTASFENLDDIVVTGVWNQAQARMEF